MKKFKFILGVFLFALFAGLGVLTPYQTVSAADSSNTPYKNSYTYAFPDRDFIATLDFSHSDGLEGDLTAKMTVETSQETLERFEKYCRKKIDSSSIGEVIYLEVGITNAADESKLNGTYKFKIKLSDFYKNKDVAVIPFSDYRSPQKLKAVNVDENGYIEFTTNQPYYAYAVVYNGVYKDLILIGVIMLVVLIICVAVKILCLRKDNPITKEKKLAKAIAKKKAAHKQNKKLAQQLKREKEKFKK